MIKERLEGDLRGILEELGIDPKCSFIVEHPSDLARGDYATNVAMAAAKAAGRSPRALAEEIAAKLKAENDPDIAEISVAGPGFINVTLAAACVARMLMVAITHGGRWGRNEMLKAKKVIVEYTDPNPFKEFHIGHLMSNAIGESISRLIEASGAETKRACYQGDVGLHVAKAIWGKMQDATKTWGEAYALGATRFEEDENAKNEIVALNKTIYARSDEKVNALYADGLRTSLERFEAIYKRLGTQHGRGRAFDFYFFESQTGAYGKKIVEEHLGTIFEKSDGAVVYKGDESKGLHTRVFINKEGLPTYEAKELGLARIKYDTYPYDISIVITANEVSDYFRVLFDVMGKVFPDLAAKTEHYAHGMLRLPTGKMSSRTGDVITAVALIDKAKEEISTKVAGVSDDVAEAAAVAAVKYSILRQAAGKDVIFDFDQSISFEGDSGPYLQYTHARARSVIERAAGAPVDASRIPIGTLSRLLVRFPDIVERASRERAPHHVANYLVEIARAFNSYYGHTQILDGGAEQPGKLALTQATAATIANGLWLLGIPSPSRM